VDSEAKCVDLSDKLEDASFNQETALRLLRLLINEAHRLQLGTIDSFFYRLLRAVSPDIGFPPEIAILSEEDAVREQTETLRRLFLPDTWNREQALAFMETVRRAQLGVENKSIQSSFEETVRLFRNYFRENSDGANWEAYPPRRRPLDSATASEVSAVLQAKARSHKKEAVLLHLATLFTLGLPLDRLIAEGGTPMGNLYRDCLAATEEFTCNIDRIKTTFDATEAAVLRGAFEEMRDHLLGEASALTRAAFDLISLHDAYYRKRMLTTGRLTFDDLSYQLSLTFGDAAFSLTAFDLALRLDASINHWLLDEFQDTSRRQWNILKPLADEIIQSEPPERTFFYVGDLKQSIYGWRGGDARLFHEIAEHYNASRPGYIHTSSLDVSYRCRPAIIEAVNEIFNPEGTWPHWISPALLKRWRQDWINHTTARLDHPGWASFRCVEEEGNTVWETIAAMLREDRPWDRGLQSALLCRTNKEVAEATEYLRRALPEAAVFSPAQVYPARDCGIVLAALSYLRYCLNPNNTLARLIVQASPLAAWLDFNAPADEAPKTSPRSILNRVAAAGLHPVWTWLGKQAKGLPLTVFEKECWDQVGELASRIDESGNASLREFLDQSESLSFRDENPSAPVQILTVHQSKGLDFDWVILPVFSKQKLIQGKYPVIQESGGGGRLIINPNQAFIPSDGWMAEALEEELDDDFFESLCLQYVAATRARHALTWVAGVVKDGGTSKSAYNFYRSILNLPDEAGSAEFTRTWGDEASFRQLHLPQRAPEILPEPVAIDPATLSIPEAPPERVIPSREKGLTFKVADLLEDQRGRTSLALGDEIHHFLETILWWSPEPELPSTLSEEARAILTAALGCPAFLAELGAPEGDPTVWREKPFEWIKGDQWISGIFDRVHIWADGSGQPTRAVIFDFKSNRDTHPEHLRASYERQLHLYREALADLLALPLSHIRAALIPLRSTEILWID
jgi:ATP-dependent helicase/nuclease subunit A